MEGTYIQWRKLIYKGGNLNIKEGTYIQWRELIYNGGNHQFKKEFSITNYKNA